MQLMSKKLLAGIALSASVFAAHAAPGPLVFSNGYAEFDNTIYGAGQTFNDVYTFSLNSLFDLGGNVFSNKLKTKFSLQDLVISDFYLTKEGVPTTKYQGVMELAGNIDSWSIDLTNLSGGNYSLSVVGNVLSGATAGSYQGQVSVSPVPEPATWGMLIGGLGLVGALARRRKASSQKTPVVDAMAAA